MLRHLAIVATVALFGCPTHKPPAVVAPHGNAIDADDPAARIRVARLEATRGEGEDKLDELARHGKPFERGLAIRALGRLGGARSLAILAELLHDPHVVGAAAGAIGVAASLDDLAPADQLALGKAVIAALEAKPAVADRRALVEALGRAGDASVQDKLVALAGDRDLAEAVAIALGRHGRRKIAISATARAALVAATGDPGVAVRFAATWALAREHEPGDDLGARTALVARLADDDPETRAQAALALARRKTVAPAHVALAARLADSDWRVAVEAVRALTGDAGDAAGREAAWQVLGHRTLDDRSIDALLETLTALLAHEHAGLVASLELPKLPDQSPLTLGWVHCRAAAIAVRYGKRSLAALVEDKDHVACGDLPMHLRMQLVAELVTAKVDTVDRRLAIVASGLASPDPRVVVAMLGTIASFVDPARKDADGFVGVVVSLLGAQNVAIAGAAIDAAEALLPVQQKPIADAIIARARAEQDPELATSLLELIGKHKLADGVGACRAGLGGHPVRAAAARSCLKAFGEAEPPAGALAAQTPPPVDVADVIGRHLRWHVMTSRGEIVIRLRPDVAPWAVAVVVSLTRRGFYDNIEFHRVVPNFVVQGGDPTMTGSGGPGFTIPAEPASGAEGPGFATGGVGIADAGRDSGGSQWFIMHSRAPHLDGRYTWFGTVETGQNLADALQIGDMVLHATVEVLP